MATVLGSQLLVVVCNINASLYNWGSYLSSLLDQLWTMFWSGGLSRPCPWINTFNFTPAPPDFPGCTHCTLPYLFHLGLLLPILHTACIFPPSCLCDVLQQWQREKRTGKSPASAIGWTFPNHGWRSVATTVHHRQQVGGGYSWHDHIGSACGRTCWICSFRIRLLLIHRY